MRDRYGPLKLSAVVALPWAVWHVPDFLAEEGWTLTALVVAPVSLAFETIALFFARVIIVWLYEGTGRSVLLVCIFHASFDATITKLSREIIPASDTVRFLVLNGVIVGAGTVIAVLMLGSLLRTDDQSADHALVATVDQELNGG